MIDLIGDIHGHADALEALLLELGYDKSKGFYAHSERSVLFIGDYIDRGPKIRETLQIVKAMVDNNQAIALMGNHEYNALCFHRNHPHGGHLRKHEIKNILQHYETLKQFHNRQPEYESYIEWFKTLPLFFKNEHFRAVHACWNAEAIRFLKTKLERNCLTESLIIPSTERKTPLYDAIDLVLKGKELPLPSGRFFKDKDGAQRTQMRIKWWENPSDMTYQKLSIEPLPDFPNEAIETSTLKNLNHYKASEKPVFFGHYWLKGHPMCNKPNVCCLDYSIAKQGKLVAYQFDGETTLSNEKLRWV